MRTHVILGGGLGNQLFQIAAGLYAGGQNTLILETGILTPNEMSTTELSRFDWPSNVMFNNSKCRPRIEKRIISFSIRQGAASRTLLVHKTLEMSATIAISLIRKRVIKVFINRGVGYDRRLIASHRDTMLIGYFQCFQWPEATKSTIEQGLINIEKELQAIAIEEFPQSKFNLLHIRLGDYLNENSFGIPGKDYFAESIKIIDNLIPAKYQSNFVVFSDSPELVSSYLDSESLKRCVIFNGSHMNSSQNLYLMSKARNFILSNSTFSWWAAFLASEKKTIVVTPSPWFAGMKSPIDLIPAGWLRQDSKFKG